MLPGLNCEGHFGSSTNKLDSMDLVARKVLNNKTTDRFVVVRTG